MKKITAPIDSELISALRAGDEVLLSGEILTGRDAAHKRLVELIESGEPLPLDISGKIIYYAGPCPAPPGKVIGSIGPTTSQRMDAYSPILMREGLKIMIGKGFRGAEVIQAIKDYKGLYLAAVGGAGALISLCVKKSQVLAFEDLGTEAIYALTVDSFPLVVAIDSYGGNIYENLL